VGGEGRKEKCLLHLTFSRRERESNEKNLCTSVVYPKKRDTVKERGGGVRSSATRGGGGG